jgi:hypothetical protein
MLGPWHRGKVNTFWCETGGGVHHQKLSMDYIPRTLDGKCFETMVSFPLRSSDVGWWENWVTMTTTPHVEAREA